MTMESPRPVLRIFEKDLAKSFYIGWLAFNLDWEYRPDDGGPSIMEVSRDGATLQLSGHYGDGSPGAKVIIEVEDIDALHRELTTERLNTHAKPGIEATDWGAKIMSIADPFGNRLVFVQRVTSDDE